MALDKTSEDKLMTVHPKLAQLVGRVAGFVPLRVLEGVRTKERQALLVEKGASKTMFSKHLAGPDGMSRAVDIAPLPIDWDNVAPYYYLAGRMIQLAADQGVKIRWGGDWDGDNDLTEEKFKDLVHFELVE